MGRRDGDKYPEPKRKYSTTVESEMGMKCREVFEYVRDMGASKLFINKPGRNVEKRIPRGTTMSELTERIKD